MEDQRFAHVASDPKFRRIPKGARKVKIDKRFQSMFKDKKFKVKYTVDKRGRPVNHTSTEDLKRYYSLSDETSSDDEPGKFVKAPHDELDVKHNSDKAIPTDIKEKLRDLKVDYARGESSLFSDASSSDDNEDDDEVEDEIEHKWGELDNDAERTETSTCRLAACNMDWDRIRAVDLMVLFSSFAPPGGVVKSVVIYPSEFGIKRMKEEEVKGPIELVQGKAADEDEGEEGSKYHMEKLRQYQLNRLRYFYAVTTCDSAGTADKIYKECDGMEYESSATKIDLRFIPDEMSFDEDAKETCEKLPELNKYQPRFFTTTALQQAKVDLTWDETDPDRVEISQKLSSGKVEEVGEADLQNFIASSDDESVENNDDHTSEQQSDSKPIHKYKMLLQEIEDKEEAKKKRGIEMEVSWGIDLKGKTEKMVKKRLEDDDDKTPFEKYLDKRKNKRKERRKAKKTDDDSDDMPSDIDVNDPYFAEELNNPEFVNANKAPKKTKPEPSEENPDLELLVMDENDHKSHFSLKQIQKREQAALNTKKRKKKGDEIDKSEDFKVNVEDARFSALFTSHLFNIDPTDPHFKKTKGMERLIEEKIKRRLDSGEEEVAKKPKREAELSVLVKSVKRKAEALNKNKNSI